VAHVVQVDLWEVGRLGESLEAPRDRVGMRRLAVLPAEQDTVVLVVRPEVLPFLVEQFDVDLENGEGERVKATALRAAAPAVRASGVRPEGRPGAARRAT
jgi:hypothetical protein